MMFEPNTAFWVPVMCMDSDGVPVTGLTPADFSNGTPENATLVQPNGLDDFTLVDVTNFREVDSGTAPGLYQVQVSSGQTADDGAYVLVLTAVVPGTFVTNRLTFQVSSLFTSVDLLRKILENRYAIFTTGPDANRMVIYDDDQTTPIIKWDLFDVDGNPTTANPYERVPV